MWNETAPPAPLFGSFYLAGFEGTTGFNARGEWIDQIQATQHDRFAELDYRLLREVGIRAAREAVRWPLVDRAGHYDFSSVRPFVSAARAQGTLAEARVGERRAYFGRFVPTTTYERARLPLGARVAGPAIVEQPDTTTVIPPGVTATVDDAGNLRLRRAA